MSPPLMNTFYSPPPLTTYTFYPTTGTYSNIPTLASHTISYPPLRPSHPLSTTATTNHNSHLNLTIAHNASSPHHSCTLSPRPFAHSLSLFPHHTHKHTHYLFHNAAEAFSSHPPIAHMLSYPTPCTHSLPQFTQTHSRHLFLA